MVSKQFQSKLCHTLTHTRTKSKIITLQKQWRWPVVRNNIWNSYIAPTEGCQKSSFYSCSFFWLKVSRMPPTNSTGEWTQTIERIWKPGFRTLCWRHSFLNWNMNFSWNIKVGEYGTLRTLVLNVVTINCFPKCELSPHQQLQLWLGQKVGKRK